MPMVRYGGIPIDIYGIVGELMGEYRRLRGLRLGHLVGGLCLDIGLRTRESHSNVCATA